MPLIGGKRDHIQRRLKELEKESRLIQADIRTLSKALQRPGALETVPSLKSRAASASRVSAPARTDPAVSSPGAAAGEMAKDLGDLFAWRGPERPRSPQAVGVPASVPSVELEGRRRTVLDDNRFLNYFASGSFVGRPPAQARRVQRNKAIFMLLIVALFGFILFKLLF